MEKGDKKIPKQEIPKGGIFYRISSILKKERSKEIPKDKDQKEAKES